VSLISVGTNLVGAESRVVFETTVEISEEDPLKKAVIEKS